MHLRKCPVCHHTLKDDIDAYYCPRCGRVYPKHVSFSISEFPEREGVFT